MRSVIAIKCGGGVLKDVNGYKQVAEYIVSQLRAGYKPIVTVSASGGMSDILINIWDDPDHIEKYLEDIKSRYKGFIDVMPQGRARSLTSSRIEERIEILKLLPAEGNRARVLAAGEDHSGIFLMGWLEEFGVNSRYFDGVEAGILVNPKGRPNRVDSKEKMRQILSDYVHPRSKTIPIVGGYVGLYEKDNSYQLMGRNTTDVTHMLVSSAFGLESSEIVKEVPGVFFVEPEILKTDVVDKLSYGEASQITWRGAKVVHPTAIEIGREDGIVIIVKKIGEDICTHIGKDSQTTPERPVAAVSVRDCYSYTIRDHIMDTEEGIGYAAEVLGIFKDYELSVFDIPTGSNRITVTSQKYKDGFENDIQKILQEKGYDPKVVMREKKSITMTGDAMKGTPGSFSKVSSVLGKLGVSIRHGTQPDEEPVEGIDDSPSITFSIDKEKILPVVETLYEELGPAKLKQ